MAQRTLSTVSVGHFASQSGTAKTNPYLVAAQDAVFNVVCRVHQATNVVGNRLEELAKLPFHAGIRWANHNVGMNDLAAKTMSSMHARWNND